MIVQGRDYEHTRGMAGPGLTYRAGDAAAIAREVLAGTAFDAAEISLSAAMILGDRGTLAVTPIPVFPFRDFIHGYLFVRASSRLQHIEELAGCRIALRDFGSTGAIWFRGLLADLGMDWRGMRWITGPKARFAPPPDAMVEPSEADPEQLLRDGAIDLFFSARVKDACGIRSLLADPAAEQAAWFTATGLSPIIHTVVMSPALPRAAAHAVFDAYAQARAEAAGRRGADMAAGLPPYGLTPGNRHAVDTLGRHLAEQGLTTSMVTADQLFETWIRG